MPVTNNIKINDQHFLYTFYPSCLQQLYASRNRFKINTKVVKRITQYQHSFAEYTVKEFQNI